MLALLIGGCADTRGTAAPAPADAAVTSPRAPVAAPSPSSATTRSSTPIRTATTVAGAAEMPGVPSAPPVLTCASYHLKTSTISGGHRPRHTAAEALTALKKAHAGPGHRTAVVLTRMAIPYAQKLGLGSPDALRLLWIIYGTDTVGPRPPGSAGPIDPYSVGTVLPVFWIIDDRTLELGGIYECSGHLPALKP